MGLLKHLFALLVLLIEWLLKRGSKPGTIENAKTPEADKRRFARGYRDWMRRKQGGDSGKK